MTSGATAQEAARQQALLQQITTTDPASRGLAVYRSNAIALAERALAAMYPTLHSLLGVDDFRQLARAHWRDEPPQRGDIGAWGEVLPDWIGRQAGLDAWPYLADCARLDALRHACERAADAVLDTDSLMLLDRHDPATLTLCLRPGAAVLVSAWPVASIFEAHQAVSDAAFDIAREAIAARKPETVWVTRRDWRAEVQRIDVETASWLKAVLAGASLASALGAAGPRFDFGRWLADALRGEWMQGVVVRCD
jgi:hypothetical protein